MPTQVKDVTHEDLRKNPGPHMIFVVWFSFDLANWNINESFLNVMWLILASTQFSALFVKFLSYQVVK